MIMGSSNRIEQAKLKLLVRGWEFILYSLNVSVWYV